MYQYIEETLNEFSGELSYDDILHMTYKELGMLKKFRRERREREGPGLKDLKLK